MPDAKVRRYMYLANSPYVKRSPTTLGILCDIGLMRVTISNRLHTNVHTMPANKHGTIQGIVPDGTER